MNGADPDGAFAEAFVFDLADEEASRLLAEDIAIVLRTGDMISLSGELGTGKTTLARAILRYLAEDDALDVPSPTYTLVQSYETRPKATHFDLYRIEAEEELIELGFEEAAETGIVLVEWPERSSLVAAEANLALAIDISPAGGRRVVARAAAETALRVSRSVLVRRFLATSGVGSSRRRALPTDASVRHYEIVEADGQRLILMNAPRPPRGPALRDGRNYFEIAHLAQDVVPFVAIARALETHGFSAPRIHAADLDAGLLLLEDLGREPIVDEANRPITERYEAAAEALALLHGRPIARTLDAGEGAAHTIPDFDREAMEIEISLLLDWFWPRHAGRAAGLEEHARFDAAWAPLLDEVLAGEKTLVLRDYHSPNILWQPDREGHRRIGMIDFQDAMIGTGAYDVASLAQDARTDMPAELEARIVAAYRRIREAEPGFDAVRFEAEYAIMAAQRATKILGIFVRLSERDGKPQYLRHIPRIQRYLERTLRHPALRGLRALYEEWGILDEPASHARR